VNGLQIKFKHSGGKWYAWVTEDDKVDARTRERAYAYWLYKHAEEYGVQPYPGEFMVVTPFRDKD
jgi:hypothetical protein